MSDTETTPDEAVAQLRVNGSDAFKKAVANLIGGLAANAGGNTLTALTTQTVSLHSADPGAAGTSERQNHRRPNPIRRTRRQHRLLRRLAGCDLSLR